MTRHMKDIGGVYGSSGTTGWECDWLTDWRVMQTVKQAVTTAAAASGKPAVSLKLWIVYVRNCWGKKSAEV